MGHLLDDFEGLDVPGIIVHVDKPGHDLMDRVERRPDTADREHAIDEFLRISAQISARPEGFLTFRHLSDDIVGVGLDLRVARAGKHESGRRKIMTHRVAADLAVRLFPPPIGLGRRRQSGRHAEIVKKPVRLETEHVFKIPVHGLLEGAVEKADIFQAEGQGADGDLGSDLRRDKCRVIGRLH